MSVLYPTSVVAFVINVFISVFVYLKNKQSAVNIVFSLYVAALAFWIVGDFFYFTYLISLFTPLFWLRLVHIGAIFTPPFFVHFIYVFTKYNYSRKFLFFLYLFSFFLEITNVFTPHFIEKVEFDPVLMRLNVSSGIFYFLFLSMIVILLPHCFYILIKRFRESSGFLKEQMKYYFLATGTVALAVVFYFPTMFGIEMPRIDNLFHVIYASIVAYAITKHRLMDISVIISRTVAELLTVVFLGAIYLGLVWLHFTY